MKLRELYQYHTHIDEHLNELTFHGSQCTKDCSGHRAGYKWSLDRGGVENPASPSQSFINGSNIGVRMLSKRAQGGGRLPGYQSQTANAVKKRDARNAARLAKGVQGTPEPESPETAMDEALSTLLNTIIDEAEFNRDEVEKRYGPLDDIEFQHAPRKIYPGQAQTPWTCWAAIQSILGDRAQLMDDDFEDTDYIAGNVLVMRIYHGHGLGENGMYIPNEDDAGGAIELSFDPMSQDAKLVATAVHEAYHALTRLQTGGHGQVYGSEKLVNNRSVKWLEAHLTGMALHVAMERITGSRVSYGQNHMPTQPTTDFREES